MDKQVSYIETLPKLKNEISTLHFIFLMLFQGVSSPLETETLNTTSPCNEAVHNKCCSHI